MTVQIEINGIIGIEYLKLREHFKKSNNFKKYNEIPIDVQFVTACLTSYKAMWVDKS